MTKEKVMHFLTLIVVIVFFGFGAACFVISGQVDSDRAAIFAIMFIVSGFGILICSYLRRILQSRIPRELKEHLENTP